MANKKNKKNNFIAVQSNEFAQHSISEFTLNQFRILYLLMSCIQREDEAFMPIQVDYRTLYCITDKNHSTSCDVGRKEYITTLVKDMAAQSFSLFEETTGTITIFPWFSYIEFDQDPKRGNVVFKFNDSLTIHLLDLDSNFTKLSLSTILSMSSVYSIKLYNLLVSHAYKGKPVTYSIDTIRTILALVNKKKKINMYEKPKDFIRWVLKPALSEINEKSDLNIEYEIVKDPKDSRKTFGFTFHITRKESFVQEAVLPPISITTIELEKHGICRQCAVVV